jgi:hypothetical protein
MKKRILDEIAEHQRNGEKVVELHLWSKEAVNAITGSPEYVGEEFKGIPVKFLGSDNQIPGMDFIVIVEG